MKTYFKCNVCGKITNGRLPKNGDGSFFYPRRHKYKGIDCNGNIIEAEWTEATTTLQNNK